jgi:hypothetical protein
MGDGGGGAMPEWLLEAGDAGFAPPKSPAHYKFEYAPHGEIDPAFDRLARDWMYQAELPASWSSEIARDYQRRAAKPPSDVELAEERAAVLARLRKHWGEATDGKLAQVRDLVHGIGDDRLIETLNRSGIGNNEWLIRQLAIFADRKAVKAAEREKWNNGVEAKEGDETAIVSSADRADQEVPYRMGDSSEDKGGMGRVKEAILDGTAGSRGDFVQLAARGRGARPRPRPRPREEENRKRQSPTEEVPTHKRKPDLSDEDPRKLEPTDRAVLIRYPNGRVYLAVDRYGKIVTTGTNRIDVYDLAEHSEDAAFVREHINPALPTIEEAEATHHRNTREGETMVVVEYRGEDGKQGAWGLNSDLKKQLPLHAPTKDLIFLTPQRMRELGLADMDTSPERKRTDEEKARGLLQKLIENLVERALEGLMSPGRRPPRPR